MKQRFLMAGLLLAIVLVGCGGGEDSVAELKKKGIDAFLKGDYVTARSYLQQGLQKAPSDRDLLYFTGTSFKRDFRYDSALVYLNRAAVLHKGDRDVAKQRLEVAMALDQWSIALSCIRTMIDTGDPPDKYYLLQSQLWKNEGWPINEYMYLRMYLDANPNDTSQYIEFANVSVTVDSIDIAQRCFDSAIARVGERPKLQAAKAVLYGAKGEYARAERILRDLLSQDTASVDVKINLANLLTNQKSLAKQREAVSLYQSAKETIGESPALDTLIMIAQQRVDSLSKK